MKMAVTPARPDANDCNEYYFLYVDRVPDVDVLALMRDQLESTPQALSAIPQDRLTYRYQPEKWTIPDILGHVIDVERAFVNRAFCAARMEQAPLPAFDQDDYVRAARYPERPLDDVLEEYAAVRRSSLVLFRSFNEAEWGRAVTASGWPLTARAVPYILAGHEMHHLDVIRERYLS